MAYARLKSTTMVPTNSYDKHHKVQPWGLSDVKDSCQQWRVEQAVSCHNQADEAEYVDPCMYGEALTGRVNKSF